MEVRECCSLGWGAFCVEKTTVYCYNKKYIEWHILVIPVLSDNYVSGENCKFSILQKDNMIVRELDFRKMEDEYVLEFNATKIEIPKELYGELASALRELNLLLNE